MHFLGDSNKTIKAWLLWAVLDIIAFALGHSTVLNPCYNYYVLCATMVYCFHQLQATHSKQTLLVTALYKACPRLTFIYTCLFCYYMRSSCPFFNITLPSLKMERKWTNRGFGQMRQRRKTMLKHSMRWVYVTGGVKITHTHSHQHCFS